MKLSFKNKMNEEIEGQICKPGRGRVSKREALLFQTFLKKRHKRDQSETYSDDVKYSLLVEKDSCWKVKDDKVSFFRSAIQSRSTVQDTHTHISATL